MWIVEVSWTEDGPGHRAGDVFRRIGYWHSRRLAEEYARARNEHQADEQGIAPDACPGYSRRARIMGRAVEVQRRRDQSWNSSEPWVKKMRPLDLVTLPGAHV